MQSSVSISSFLEAEYSEDSKNESSYTDYSENMSIDGNHPRAVKRRRSLFSFGKGRKRERTLSRSLLKEGGLESRHIPRRSSEVVSNRNPLTPEIFIQRTHSQDYHSLNSGSSQEEGIPAYMTIPNCKFSKPKDLSDLHPTIEELNSYFTWIKEIVHLQPEEGLSQEPTWRMSLFLFFLRLQVPLEEITQEHIGTDREWLRNRRGVIDSVVQYVRVPVSENLTSIWWCSTNMYPSNISTDNYQFVCHYRHTYILPKRMVRIIITSKKKTN